MGAGTSKAHAAPQAGACGQSWVGGFGEDGKEPGWSTRLTARRHTSGTSWPAPSTYGPSAAGWGRRNMAQSGAVAAEGRALGARPPHIQTLVL